MYSLFFPLYLHLLVVFLSKLLLIFWFDNHYYELHFFSIKNIFGFTLYSTVRIGSIFFSLSFLIQRLKMVHMHRRNFSIFNSNWTQFRNLCVCVSNSKDDTKIVENRGQMYINMCCIYWNSVEKTNSTLKWSACDHYDRYKLNKCLSCERKVM